LFEKTRPRESGNLIFPIVAKKAPLDGREREGIILLAARERYRSFGKKGGKKPVKGGQ